TYPHVVTLHRLDSPAAHYSAREIVVPRFDPVGPEAVTIKALRGVDNLFPVLVQNRGNIPGVLAPAAVTPPGTTARFEPASTYLATLQTMELNAVVRTGTVAAGTYTGTLTYANTAALTLEVLEAEASLSATRLVVRPGETRNFTVTLWNNGSVPLEDVSLQGTWQTTGLTPFSVSPASSRTVTVTVTVPLGMPPNVYARPLLLRHDGSNVARLPVEIAVPEVRTLGISATAANRTVNRQMYDVTPVVLTNTGNIPLQWRATLTGAALDFVDLISFPDPYYGTSVRFTPGTAYYLSPGESKGMYLYTFVPASQAPATLTGSIRFDIVEEGLSGAGSVRTDLRLTVRDVSSAEETLQFVVDEGTTKNVPLTFANGVAPTTLTFGVRNDLPNPKTLSRGNLNLPGHSVALPTGTQQVNYPITVANRGGPSTTRGLFAVSDGTVTGYIPASFTIPARVQLQFPADPVTVFVPRGGNETHHVSVFNDGNIHANIDVVLRPAGPTGALHLVTDRLGVSPGQTGRVALRITPPTDAPVNFTSRLDFETVSGTFFGNLTVLTDLGALGAVVVSPRGDGHFTTLQGAINSLRFGGRIVVYNGTYNEDLVLNKPVILQARDGPAHTILRGTSSNPTVRVAAAHATLEGFTVQAPGFCYWWGCFDYTAVYVDAYQGYFTLANSTVTGSSTYLMELGYQGHHHVITNTTLRGPNTGIYAYYVSDSQFTKLKLENFNVALQFYYGARNLIADNEGINLRTGVEITGMTAYTLERNTFTGRGAATNQGRGLDLRQSADFTLADNRLQAFGEAGVRLQTSERGTLRRNRLQNNRLGLDLADSNDNRYYRHTFDSTNTINGIPILYIADANFTARLNRVASFVLVVGSNNITLGNVTVTDQTERLLILDSQDVTLATIRTEAARMHVRIVNSRNVDVQDVTAGQLTAYVAGSHRVSVRNAAFRAATTGNDCNSNFHWGVDERIFPLYVDGSNDFRLQDSSVGPSWCGMVHTGGARLRVENVRFTNITGYYIDNMDALKVTGGKAASHSARIANSTFTGPGGLNLEATTRATVDGNRFTNNVKAFRVHDAGIGRTDFDLDYVEHTVYTNNLIDGKQVVYLRGVSGSTTPVVLRGNAGFLYLVRSDNIVVEGLTLSGSAPALGLFGTNKVRITDLRYGATDRTLRVVLHNAVNTTFENTTLVDTRFTALSSADLDVRNVSLRGRNQDYTFEVHTSPRLEITNATFTHERNSGSAVLLRLSDHARLTDVAVSGIPHSYTALTGLRLEGSSHGQFHNLSTRNVYRGAGLHTAYVEWPTYRASLNNRFVASHLTGTDAALDLGTEAHCVWDWWSYVCYETANTLVEATTLTGPGTGVLVGVARNSTFLDATMQNVDLAFRFNNADHDNSYDLHVEDSTANGHPIVYVNRGRDQTHNVNGPVGYLGVWASERTNVLGAVLQRSGREAVFRSNVNVTLSGLTANVTGEEPATLNFRGNVDTILDSSGGPKLIVKVREDTRWTGSNLTLTTETYRNALELYQSTEPALVDSTVRSTYRHSSSAIHVYGTPGFHLSNTAVNVTGNAMGVQLYSSHDADLDRNRFEGDGRSLHLSNTFRATLTNNTFVGKGQPLEISEASSWRPEYDWYDQYLDHRIDGTNKVNGGAFRYLFQTTDSEYFGSIGYVFALGARNVTLRDGALLGGGQIRSSNYVNLTNLGVTSGQALLLVDTSTNVRLQGTRAGGDGLRLQAIRADNLRVEGVSLGCPTPPDPWTSYIGLEIDSSSNVVVGNNTVRGCATGIDYDGRSFFDWNCWCTRPARDGAQFLGNDVKATAHALQVQGGRNHRITDNHFVGRVYLPSDGSNLDGYRVLRNVFENPAGNALEVSSARSGFRAENNTFRNATVGFHIRDSTGVPLRNNTFHNLTNGFYFARNQNLVLRHNAFTAVRLAVNMEEFQYSWNRHYLVHDIDATNRVDGNSILIQANQASVTLTGPYGQVVLIDVPTVTFSGFTLAGDASGLVLSGVRSLTVTGSTIGSGMGPDAHYRLDNALALVVESSTLRGIRLEAHGADVVRLANSTLNATGQTLYLANPGTVTLENVSLRSATLNAQIYNAEGAVTVANSTFTTTSTNTQHLNVAYAAGQVRITSNTFTGGLYGVLLSGYTGPASRSLIADNTFLGVRNAMYLVYTKPADLLRNTVDGAALVVHLYGTQDTVVNDTVATTSERFFRIEEAYLSAGIYARPYFPTAARNTLNGRPAVVIRGEGATYTSPVAQAYVVGAVNVTLSEVRGPLYVLESSFVEVQRLAAGTDPVYLVSSRNVTLRNAVIPGGLGLGYTEGAVIENAALNGSDPFRIEPSFDPYYLRYYTHTLTNVTVGGAPLAYAVNRADYAVDGFGRAFLAGVGNATLRNGAGTGGAAIFATDVDNLLVEGVRFRDVQGTALQITNGGSATLRDIRIDGTTQWGIRVEDMARLDLQNFVVNRSYYQALYAENVGNFTVAHGRLTNTTYTTVEVEYVGHTGGEGFHHVRVENSTYQYAFAAEEFTGAIHNNTFRGGRYGQVDLDYGVLQFHDNLLRDGPHSNYQYLAYMYSVRGNMTRNLFEAVHPDLYSYGLYLYYADGLEFGHNTVRGVDSEALSVYRGALDLHHNDLWVTDPDEENALELYYATGARVWANNVRGLAYVYDWQSPPFALFERNYWHEYRGTDSNADGYGDTPFAVNGNTVADPTPKMTPYALTTYRAQAVELTPVPSLFEGLLWGLVAGALEVAAAVLDLLFPSASAAPTGPADGILWLNATADARFGAGFVADDHATWATRAALRETAGPAATGAFTGPGAAEALYHAALAGHDPAQVATALATLRNTTSGQYGTTAADTAFALLALKALNTSAADPRVTGSLDWLRAAQRADGGVGLREATDRAHALDTAVTALAFQAWGRGAEAGKALRWLQAHEDRNGLWGFPRATLYAHAALLAEGARNPVRESLLSNFTTLNGYEAGLAARLLGGAERLDHARALLVRGAAGHRNSEPLATTAEAVRLLTEVDLPQRIPGARAYVANATAGRTTAEQLAKIRITGACPAAGCPDVAAGVGVAPGWPADAGHQAEALLTLHRAGPLDEETREQGAARLAAFQTLATGSFGTPWATARAALALHELGLRAEAEEAALQHLLGRQGDDGSLDGDLRATGAFLEALSARGNASEASAQQAAYAWIASQQGSHGAWTDAEGRASAPLTALALRALFTVAVPALRGPDVAVGAASLDGTLRQGVPVNVTVPLTNVGPDALLGANVTVRVGTAANGTLLYAGALGPLAPGEAAAITFPWTPARGNQALVTRVTGQNPRDLNTVNDLGETRFVVPGYGVSLTADRLANLTTRTTPAGFALTVENVGDLADTFTFTGAPNAAGWTVGFAPASLALAPGANGTVHATVQAPGTAEDGASARVLVTAASAGDATTVDTLTLEARVPDSVPPVITSYVFPTGTVLGAGPALVTLRFNEPLDAAFTPAVTFQGPGNATLAPTAVTAHPTDAAAFNVQVTFEATDANGPWRLAVAGARDLSGNEMNATTGGAFTLDTAPPTTTLTLSPDTLWAKGDVTVTFHGVDNTSSVARTVYRLNAGRNTTATGPLTLTAEGVHTLRYFSVDAAGNTETVKESTVRIDRTLPTGSVFEPRAGALVRSRISLRGEASDLLSGIAQVQVEVRNGTNATVLTLPATLSGSPTSVGWATTLNTTLLGDGNHTYVVRFTDQAGNEAVAPARLLRVDNTPPTLTVFVAPDPSNGLTTLTVTSSEALAATPVLRVRPAGGANHTVGLALRGSNLWVGTFTVTTTRLHYANVTGTDPAGNSNLTVKTFVGDVRPPDGPFITPLPGEALNVTAFPVSFRYLENVTASFQVDGRAAAFERNGTAYPTYAYTLANLTQGWHSVAGTARDVAGNYRIDTSYYLVDTERPRISGVTNISEVPAGRIATVFATVHDNFGLREVFAEVTLADGTVLRYPMARSIEDLRFGNVGPLPANQSMTFRVVAIDLARNRNVSHTQTIFVPDLTPPTVRILHPILWDVEGLQPVNVTVGDNEQLRTVVLAIDGVPIHTETLAPGTRFARFNWTWDTFAFAAGWHVLSVNATDGSGNRHVERRDFRVVNPPVLAVTHSPEVPRPGDAITFTLNVTEGRLWYRGLTFTYRVNGGDPVTQRFVVHPAIDQVGPGNYTVTVPGLLPADTLAWVAEVEDWYHLPARATGSLDVTPRLEGGNITDILRTARALFPTNASQSLPANESYADILEAGASVSGAWLYAGMNLSGDLTKAGALYIVDFDVATPLNPLDGVADFNLTASFVWNGTERDWTVRFHDNRTKTELPAPTLREHYGNRSLAFEVNLAALRVSLGLPSDLNVSFRTVGSGDNTPFHALDIVDPAVSFTPAATATSGASFPVTATLTDASGIASALLTVTRDDAPTLTVPMVRASGDTWTSTVPAQAPGNLTLVVSAVDGAGRSGTSPARLVTVTDATAPTLANLTLTATTLRAGVDTVTVRVDVTDNLGVGGVTATLFGQQTPLSWLGGNRFEATLGPYGTAATGTLAVTAADVSGLTAALTREVRVLDGQPPAVTNVTLVSQLNVGEPLTVTADVVDASAVTVHLALTKGTTTTTVPATNAGSRYTMAAGSIPIGNYTYRVVAVDADGNRAESDPVPLRVLDLDLPQVVDVTVPATATAGAATPVTAVFRDGSGVSRATLQWSGPAGATGTLALTLATGAAGENQTFTGSLVLPALGLYAVTLTAEDPAGASTTTAPVTVEATDGSAPTITVVSPASGAITGDRPTVSVTYSDESGINASSFLLMVDGAAVTGAVATATGATWTPATALATGLHTVQARVADTLGHEATVSWTFTVDGTPPTLTVVSPLNGAHLTERRPTVSFAYTDLLGIDPASVTLTVDGVARPAEVTPAAATWTPLVDLASGLHMVHATAADLNGNVAHLEWAFTIDGSPPTLAVEQPVPGSETHSRRPMIAFTYTDTEGVDESSVTLTVDGVPVPVVATRTRAQGAPPTDLGYGVHTVVATARDVNGNLGTLTWTFTVLAPASSVGPAPGKD
ncbi:MAG TPA: right-handed parallel beta-helix repeat-containing protein, partial [Candidatus Thermoplasmatota archaeon]|nr:right-handed parallel beta-helix repeat-containing protein [Candidatus Thermoplasmatota archaeon]